MTEASQITFHSRRALPEQNPPSFGVTLYLASQFAGPLWALLMPFVIQSQPEGPRETQGARAASDQAL
jgi:hypothetical protein